MARCFSIQGGKPLSGCVNLSGSKFSTIPMLAATLLTKHECYLSNIPLISDVSNMISALVHLGAEVSFISDNAIVVNTRNVNGLDIPDDLIKSMRGTFLFFPALLVKRGYASIAWPHGCRLGSRPFFEHLRVISSFGVKVSCIDNRYVGFVKNDLHPARVELHGKNSSPGATKSFLIMASATSGESIINNASILPEVIEFCSFLKRLGVRININGTKIVVQRSGELRGCSVKIEADRIEGLTWAILAGITNGEIFIVDGDVSLFRASNEWRVLKALGINVSKLKNGILVKGNSNLLGDVDIITGAYPAFNTDAHPLFAPLLMRAKSQSSITEKVFGENRFSYLKELQKMGGKFQISNNKVRIFPSSNLKGSIVYGGDIRATASLLLSALGIPQKSFVFGIEYLNRGYCNFLSKAQSLGANISEITK